MHQSKTMEKPAMVANDIPGYTYGSTTVARSPITVKELEQLKESAGFTNEDERWLRAAGDVLKGQAKQLVEKWRAVISAHPHLARYSLRLDGQKDPHYSEASGMRFQQWVLDTCFRPYDQDWLNYQQEIALRHTTIKKNKTDNVQSVPSIHLRDIVAFTAVISDPDIIKPFLAAKGHPSPDIDKMYQAWRRSVQLQIALWTEPYSNSGTAPDQW